MRDPLRPHGAVPAARRLLDQAPEPQQVGAHLQPQTLLRIPYGQSLIEASTLLEAPSRRGGIVGSYGSSVAVRDAAKPCGPSGCACRPNLITSDGGCAGGVLEEAQPIPDEFGRFMSPIDGDREEGGDSTPVSPDEGDDDGEFKSPTVEDEVETVVKPICCPDLDYPIGVTLLDPKKGPARLPQYGRPLGKKHKNCALIRFTFGWKAVFASSPVPCRCSCCEFRQKLLQNEVTLEQQGKDDGSGGKSWNGTYADPGAGQEDCRWTYQVIDETTPNGKPEKGETYPRFGGPDKEPGPYPAPPKSILVKGPECFGHRKGGEGGKGAAPDPGYPPGDDCIYSGKDTPSVVIPPKCKFTWIWKAKAFILDTCAGGELEPHWIDITVTGETNSEGRVKGLHLTQTVTQYASRPAYPGER